MARRECISEVLRQRRAASREPSLFIVRPDGEQEERRDIPGVPAQASLMVARLWYVLAELRPREREVLVRRYGLEGEEATYAEIARGMGLCRKTVRSIEARALGRLRRALSRRP